MLQNAPFGPALSDHRSSFEWQLTCKPCFTVFNLNFEKMQLIAFSCMSIEGVF